VTATTHSADHVTTDGMRGNNCQDESSASLPRRITIVAYPTNAPYSYKSNFINNGKEENGARL
jgi:hypothetical protein